MNTKAIIRKALKDTHKNETLERAIGRIVRQEGGTYEVYIKIMSDLREKALAERITVFDAARMIAGEN